MSLRFALVERFMPLQTLPNPDADHQRGQHEIELWQGANMGKEAGKTMGLPTAVTATVAVVADGLIIAFIVRALLLWQHVDPVPFDVLVTACLINALNITLILLRRKLPRRVFRALGLIAIVGNVTLLGILSLVAVVKLAMIGGGGNAGGGYPYVAVELELMAFLAVIAAAIVLNIVLITYERERTAPT
jgi:hypothetical protein